MFCRSKTLDSNISIKNFKAVYNFIRHQSKKFQFIYKFQQPKKLKFYISEYINKIGNKYLIF